MSREDIPEERVSNGHSNALAATARVRTVLGEAAHHVHHTNPVGAHASVPYAADIA